MNLRRKTLLIVIISILMTAIPASVMVFKYTQTTLLVNELNELVSLTSHQASMISQRFSEGKPKLESLASLLQKDLSKPINANEIKQFHETMEQYPDGVWRNKRAGFDGKTEAGVFLPERTNESDQQKLIHLRIKHAMDYFGAATNDYLENAWYLSPERSEIIFDRNLPNFVFEQAAENDYTQTPRLTYASPEFNPDREYVFTPPLLDSVSKKWMVSALFPLYLDGRWLGALGEDIPLSNMLASLQSELQLYQSAQLFLLDKEGNFILAGNWQDKLESTSGSEPFNLTAQPEVTRLLSTNLNVDEPILSQNILISGKRYVAVGMVLEPLGWRFFKLVEIDEILQETRQLFWGLVGLIFLASILSGILVSFAVNRNIVERIRQLADALRIYQSGSKFNLATYIPGNDEISLAAKEFDVMADRINQNMVDIKDSNDKLKESEERWKFALEGAGDGIWDWNIKTGEVLFSKQCKKMLGYEEHEFADLASEFESHLHPEDKTRMFKCLDDYFSNQQRSYAVEFRMRCKDGSWKWVLARGMLISRDKSLAPERMIGTHTDISLQKEIENKLRDSSTQLRFMLENSPIAVRIAVDHGRKVVFANKAYTDLVNLTDGDVIGADPKKYYVNPSDYLASLSLLEKGKSVKNKLVELQIPNQELKWALASYLSIEYENQQAVLGWFYDISDRLKAEESLRLHASVFDNAWEGIVITDANNRIISINAAFTHISGYKPEDVVGKDPKILSSGLQDEAFYQKMWRSLQKTGHWRGEVSNRKANGDIYIEILAVSAVKDINNRITHYVGVFADITDIKNTEKRLENMAHYDQLTGLPNRVLLADRLDQNLAQTKRSDKLLAICFLDLDGFKEVNDNNGHDIGDKLLIEAARRLSSEIRTGDTVARLGGDEFVVLLTNVTDMKELDLAITRLNHVIAEPMLIEGMEFSISTSIGLTVSPTDDSDPETLIRHADLAMYEAKQAGRNRYKVFDAELYKRSI